MREIKFRSFHSGRGMIYDVHKLWSSNGESFGHVIDDTHHLVMQFVGLRDKHGRDIYEGDIVRHRRFDVGDMALYGVGAVLEGDRPIRVEFSHCGFQPFANWINDRQTDFEWEVIGNIYENPELLGDSKQAREY